MYKWPKHLLRLAQLLVLCTLAVTMLGAGGDASSTRFSRIGHNMICVCSCGQVLLECNHVGCPDSSRMIGELTDQMAGPNGGGADSLILNWFVAKYGATVLAAPIRGGFDLVAWFIPLTLFVAATLGTAFLVRHWAARRSLQPASLADFTPPVSDSTRDRIRRETEY